MKNYELNEDILFDRVYGCWSGKCIGGNAGAPNEGNKKMFSFQQLEDLPAVHSANDDLDIQLVWLHVLRKTGCRLDVRTLAEAWLENITFPWSEYKIARRNLARGIFPPLSGLIDNSFFRESMGCPIRSEIWGVVAAGEPEKAAALARLDGAIDHFGFAVDAEAFLAAWLSLVLADTGNKPLTSFINDAAVIAGGEMPGFCQQVTELVQKNSELPLLWERLQTAFPSVDGMDARINVSIILAAAWLGAGDFEKTLISALNMGYDTDCTGATIGALLGARYGRQAMDKRILALTEEKIRVTPYLHNLELPVTITELTRWSLDCRKNMIAQSVPVYPPVAESIEVPSWKWQIIGPLYNGHTPAVYETLSTVPFEHGSGSTLPPFSHILKTDPPACPPYDSIKKNRGTAGMITDSIGDSVYFPAAWRRFAGGARIIASRTVILKQTQTLYLAARYCGKVFFFWNDEDVTLTSQVGSNRPLEHLGRVQARAGKNTVTLVLDSYGVPLAGFELSFIIDKGAHPHQHHFLMENPDSHRIAHIKDISG
ncbi:MAG TPA: hypothetical protein DC049_00910 [Spirochaetia bacterium]|nr:hypothetical protein [Spirochaetia bacterium]